MANTPNLIVPIPIRLLQMFMDGKHVFTVSVTLRIPTYGSISVGFALNAREAGLVVKGSPDGMLVNVACQACVIALFCRISRRSLVEFYVGPDAPAFA